MSNNAINAPVSTFMKTVLDDATASDARTTLGAAASGANSDISSLTALTGDVGNSVQKFRHGQNPTSNLSVTGLCSSGTAGENFDFASLLYMSSDGKWYKADNTNLTKYPSVVMAAEAGTTNNSFVYLERGIASNLSWSWTKGGLLYLTTSGGMTQTQPTSNVQAVGIATDTFLVSFNPVLYVAGVFTDLTISGQPNFTGNTLIQKYVAANTSTAYTMDAKDGMFFDLTLNGDATITVTETIASSQSQLFSARITQDGTGGRTLAWSGVTWMSGVAPVMPTAIAAFINVSFVSINGSILGFSQLSASDSATLNAITLTSGINGRTSGSSYASGFVGEVIESTIAIGSATSLTTATAKTITSISLTAGVWQIWGNIGFIAASGTLATNLEGSISTTTNTQATSPNSGAYFNHQLAFTVSTSQVCPVGLRTVNISSTTVYYLVATATFTVSTLTAYGYLGARRVA